MKDSNDNIQVHLAQQPGQAAELVIRHGAALPQIASQAIHLIGQINAPAEFLLKRADIIDPNSTHILVDEHNATIVLTIGEATELASTIVGKMIPNPDFAAFRINGSDWESPKAFGEFLRRNRQYFSDDKEKFVKLVDSLINFKARVEKELESSNDSRGNKRELAEQKVSTAIPTSFTMSIPLHKGGMSFTFEVEIFFDVRDAGCKINLQSIEAEELRRKEVRNLIDVQIPVFQPYVTIFI